ncbi:hypothetical protein C7B77_01940 [Chamaesiphon polymorphus CCALA 037]|uniref:PKD domain-containing protein n=2 Tax=Chamaesiphon TaxID=217161 RepID=A0A2T1GMR5_9CYAN|nr:PKD domain-containing protein [Chamaesiphon polymorphus]PSB59176.1 hypothetical protein C7B77_01940 [Chamaesiphon polymorphus CCALA 037]
MGTAHPTSFGLTLHFIGFGRSNIVNSEVVQRLGTDYPLAGGTTVDNRDLQMTSIDLPGNTSNILDPTYTVWNNVTYADNYYFDNTVSGSQVSTKAVTGADWQVNLNGLAGFETPGNSSWNPHLKTLAWYLGTADVNKGEVARESLFSPTGLDTDKIYRRLGDLYSNGAQQYSNAQTWYTPDNTLSNVARGDSNAVWEGIGTGWFHSVLGGGYSTRPYKIIGNKVSRAQIGASFNSYLKLRRTDVSFDNTNVQMSGLLRRGDYAVSTVFNGNFDAITNKFDSQWIPGWSTYNGSASNTTSFDTPTQSNLVYGEGGNQSFALKLGGGFGSLQSVTHNRFTVPDWGVLRFDLYAPNTGGTIEVSLEEVGNSSNRTTQTITLQDAIGPYDLGYNDADTYRLGYARTGFETFHINVDQSLRGKAATLKFTMNGGTAYLDNVFFKSEHLLLGNPSEARNPSDNLAAYSNNYLLERPQYSLSYNNDNKGPNWVAWKLNQSWRGNLNRPATSGGIPVPDNYSSYSGQPKTDFPFQLDQALPSSFNRLDATSYRLNGQSSYYHRGHMARSSDRNRTAKDQLATYFMSNILPQTPDNNTDAFRSPWQQLENYSTATLVGDQNKDLYIYAGGYGSTTPYEVPFIKPPQNGTTTNPLQTNNINVPEFVWKVIVGLAQPGHNLGDIESNPNILTDAVAVLIPNIQRPRLPDPNNPGKWLKDPTDPAGKRILFVPFSATIPGTAHFAARTVTINTIDEWKDWTKWAIPIRQLEELTELNFSSNLSEASQNAIENQIRLTLPIDIIDLPDSVSDDDVSDPTANLLAESSSIQSQQTSIEVLRSFNNMPFLGNSVVKESPSKLSLDSFSSQQGSIFQVGSLHSNSFKIGITEVSSSEIASHQASFQQISSGKIGISEIASAQVNLLQTSSTQINSAQVNFNEKSLTSSITLQQLLSSHNPNLQNTTVPTWTEFLQSPTPFNLKIEVTDLPTGQLAEATITGYDTLGRPNSGTLTLDINGNNLGWFIDTTPDDNSEFTTQLADTAYKATADSAAYGKYDLLTTILHELGHLNGIIRGNSAFDAYIQNINGVPTFINGGLTATLTPDGSHLDTTFHPYDLMNTSLKPGVRKLPSALNLAMIDTVNAGVGGWVSGVDTLNSANLTAGALIGINNGDFATTADWNTLGATNIINGTATLTEQSQKLSELTQAFIIPTGAKTLQFTIIDNHLVTGDTTKSANDAFEVALIDTNTFNPLAGTSIGLNHTDSLLNIQANGTIHKSDKVTITALGNNSSIVTIDLTQVTPATQATLYFNLIGFGARTSTITIDDVKLFTDTQPIPVTNNDTLTTTQNTPLTLDPTQLTTNDTNVTQIQIINQPIHGTLTQTPDGKFTYQPVSTYVGTDSFKYIGFGSDGQISNLATVNITINNLPPTIQTVTIPTTITEGQTIQLSAVATDGGSSNNLTYIWNLGDGTTPIVGRNITHTYTDNGNYNLTLTVTDIDGGSTSQTTNVTVDNVAPTATITTPTTTINQGETLNLGVNYSDPGINDTHTITWNFDDGTAPITLTPSSVGADPNLQPHTFTKAGNRNVTVTITDNDGASTTTTIQIAVTNIAPTITNLNLPTNINEGQPIQLTATATDPGNDTLIYNWYINGATTPVVGQTIDYTFPDNGIYPVKLDVIDTDGAITTRTVDVTVDNIAPTIVSIDKPATIKEGESVSFTANAIDPGSDDTLAYSKFQYFNLVGWLLYANI